ncbi:sensor histidine kinase [Streptomyces sp. NPDC005279]|uniref:sensor histidine kinase n=1 Tax=Streptomyces sp. NPDC005279 TaxID=3364712 RepID=UPI0036CDE37D
MDNDDKARLAPAARTALRSFPRTLREDLCTLAADPLPRIAKVRWLAWLPHVIVVWLSIPLFLANSDELESRSGLGAHYGLLLAAFQSGALILAMFRPVPAWWLSLVPTLFVAAGEPRPDDPWPWPVTGILAHAGVLLLLSLRVRPRVAVEALLFSCLSGLVLEGIGDRPHDTTAPVAALVFTVVVIVGGSLRGRREARTRLVEQEVLTAEERARRTLLEERSRIARELHDVVAHHMSVISIQAQVAPHLVEDPSEELKENLAGIRENAVDALTELRRVLGVLRSENPGPNDESQTPQPTLARLGALVDNVRSAGLTVTTEVDNGPRPLSPGIELSAFRIVQEALSNAMRHAPGSMVRVRIAYGPAGLTVRVTNTAPAGPVPASPGAGHGLLGMRERAVMLGGEVTTGPTADGGYEVTATLPLNGTPMKDNA